MAIFFTADHHFGHKNIILPTHADRPFADVHEMNKVMVERWNQVVGKGDTVYHLGDIVWGNPPAMKAILDRLHGKIVLVFGNHDKVALKPPCVERFDRVVPPHMDLREPGMLELTVPDRDASKGRQLIVLSHYSMRVWNCRHWGAWHLYGHSHGGLADDPRSLSFDVGVDAWDFTPVSYAQVKARMATKTWTPFKPRR